MSKDNKRRDSKGRILRTGEQQRQDGKFMYAYRGRDGEMHYVYSWKLEPTDKLPAGISVNSLILRQLDLGVENLALQYIARTRRLHHLWWFE